MGNMGIDTLGLLSLLIGISLGQLAFDCPPPWKQFKDRCYKFDLFPTEYLVAEDNCAKDGASLLSVNTQEEHDFIAQWLSTNDRQKQEWYTSGRRDSEDLTKFSWEGDGTEITGVQFWLSNEDRYTPGSVVVYRTDGASWGWTIRPFTDPKPYICEISRADRYKIVEEERTHAYGVGETDINMLEIGPKFIQQPENQVYDKSGVDNFVSMECIAGSKPASSYKWMTSKESLWVEIDPLFERRYTITNGRLTIEDPQDSVDNGDYQCVAENKFGSVLSNIVELGFGYLNDFPKSTRDPVRVDQHSGTGIECNPPKHYPEILYSWYKDSIMNFIRPALKPYAFISSNGKLYFSEVTKDDAGEYFCLVFSPQAHITAAEGKVSMPIQLIVQEAIGSIREPQIASGFPTVFPSSPKRGDNVRIECFAWGTGILDYSWERIEGPLPGGSFTTDHNRILNIPNVDVVHEGDFKCTVRRRNGLSSSQSVQMSIDAAPFFTIPLKDQFVDTGADLTWRCIAKGIPSVTYSWYRDSERLDPDNYPLELDGRIEINKNVLTLNDVQPSDEGMFQCAATNLHGRRFSAGQLSVMSFKPTFAKYPLEDKIYGARNGEATIVCNPEAAPTPIKEWKKDGRNLQPSTDENARMYTLPNGNLHITQLTKSDEGEYECIAKNDLGMDSSSGILVILPSTVISYSPQNTVVHVNRTAFFHCQASFNPLLDLTYSWIHNGFPIEFIKVKSTGTNQITIYRDPHYERGAGLKRGGLYIINAQFEHAGEYVCEAVTTTGSISKIALLTVIGPPGMAAGVYGEGATSSSVMLTWTPGAENGREITNFIVEGMNTMEGQWKTLKTNIDKVDSVRQSTNITGLNPYSTYQFRVRAENSLGIGASSESSPSYTTLAAKPVVPVKNVGGGGGKVGDLTITWDPLEKADLNGPGVGYRIYWKKKEMFEEDWESRDITDPTAGRYVHTVGSKNYYLPYVVKVQPFNDKGDGPMSPEVNIQSAEDIPTKPPTNIRAVQFNSTALLVEWDPVPNTREAVKGVLKGYRINYWKEIGEDETMAIYQIILGQTDHGLVIGLEADTYYIVNVQAYNTAGNGPKSQEFVEETLRLSPQNQPTEVDVFVKSSNAIRVKWRGVSTDQREEPLQGYMVRYWKQGESIYVAQNVDAMKKTQIDVTDLDQNEMYNLRVLGYSRGGDGLMSSPVIQFVLGPYCRVMQDTPDKEFIYKCHGCSVQASVFTLSIVVIYHIIGRIL